MRYLLVIFILMAVPRPLNAQGMFLSPGQSGFGAEATFQGSSDESGYGISAGYSYAGLLDIGGAVSRSIVSSSLAGGGVNVTSVGPSVVLHAKEGTALSLALEAGYRHGFYSSEAVAGSHIGLKKDYALGGTVLYGRIPLTETSAIVPSASVMYTTANASLSDGFENRLLSSDTNPFIISLAAAILYQTSPSLVLRFSPQLVINENATGFALTAGLVLPTGKY